MTTLYHIRRPLLRVGKPGYRNPANVVRSDGTHCGADPTVFDAAHADNPDKLGPFAHDGVVMACCLDCLRIRKGA